jgi:hypothetical protein
MHTGHQLQLARLLKRSHVCLLANVCAGASSAQELTDALERAILARCSRGPTWSGDEGVSTGGGRLG